MDWCFKTRGPLKLNSLKIQSGCEWGL